MRTAKFCIDRQFIASTGRLFIAAAVNRYLQSAAVAGLLLLTPPAFATSWAPPGPDPWFTIWVQIESRSLPPGVNYRHVRFRDENRIIGYFTNSSSTPFYLVTRQDTPPGWMLGLPTNVAPRWMAVSGAAYTMQSGIWRLENFPGILVEQYSKLADNGKDLVLEMDAYLGGSKIAVRGRVDREREGNRWKNHITLDTDLPDGVRFAEIPASHGRLVIVNDGKVPMFTGVEFPQELGWITEVPRDYLALYKLFENRTYFGERLFPTVADGWKRTLPYDARLTEREFEMYIPGIELKQRYEDNRPEKIDIPDSQYFAMTAFYGSQEVTIRGRIVYDLNPFYDPVASQAPPDCMSCMFIFCDECPGVNSHPRQNKRLPTHSSTY